MSTWTPEQSDRFGSATELDLANKRLVGRAGTSDEVAALIMDPEGGFVTGSDLLVDGGATADVFYGLTAST